MKNFILLMLICSLSICTNAQKIRFTDSNNVWRVAGPHADVYYTYTFGPDTVIGEKRYRRLFEFHEYLTDTFYQFTGHLIREDTITDRVYARNLFESDPSDTPEYILYRYDLNLGDTAQFRYYTDSVVAIDSILIGGNYYKVITFQNTGEYAGFYHYTYIEGIGALQGPLYAIILQCFYEYSFALCCFQHDGSYPDIYLEYRNCWYDWAFENADCNCINPPYLGINNTAKIKFKAEVVPNPCQPSSLLQWRETIELGRLRIADATGRNVLNQEIKNSSRIPVGQLINKPGIYFYELTDIKNKRSARGKLVIF